jgi:hypothetical protein
MATQVFITNFTNAGAARHWSSGNNDAKLNGSTSGWADRSLQLARHSIGPSTLTTSTVAGPTAGLEMVETYPVFWVSPPLDADVTIAGSITFNLWAGESSMSANVAINAIIEKIDGATGAFTTIHKTVRTAELGTTRAAANFAETPTSTACKKGDRLRIRVFGDDAGTMASGYTFNFSHSGGTAGGDGDSYVTFTETIGFITTDPTGTTLYPTDTASGAGGVASLLSAFTGADEIPLSEGGVWAVLDSSKEDLDRVSNQVAPSSAATAGSYHSSSIGPDVEAYVTIAAYAGNSNAGVAVRVQGGGGAATWDGYLATGNSTLWMTTLWRVTDGVLTQIANYGGLSPSDGDKIGISAHGSEISLWRMANGASTWTLLRSVIDTTYANAGNVALYTETSGAWRLDDLYASAVAGTFSLEREAWTSRGASVQTDVTNTTSGWTPRLQTTDTAGGIVVDWLTKPLEAVTLAGAVLVNARWLESNVAGDLAWACEIAICNGDGLSPVVWALNSFPAEMTASEVAYQFYLSGDDTSVTQGQRLRIRFFLDDPTYFPMVSPYTGTLYYAGTSGGASGDTYLTFTQTLTEFVAVARVPRFTLYPQLLAH